MTDLGAHAFTMINWALCFLTFLEIFLIAFKDYDVSALLAGISMIIATWIVLGTIGLCGLFIFTTILFVLFIRENRKKAD